MLGEYATILSIGIEHRFRVEAAFCQYLKQGWGTMALAEDEAVSRCVAWLGWINPHYGEVQDRQNVDAGKAGTQVRDSGFGRCLDYPSAEIACRCFQGCNISHRGLVSGLVNVVVRFGLEGLEIFSHPGDALVKSLVEGDLILPAQLGTQLGAVEVIGRVLAHALADNFGVIFETYAQLGADALDQLANRNHIGGRDVISVAVMAG